MEQYKTILVAAALDDRDIIALQHAAHFAHAAEAVAVHVVHVAPADAAEDVDASTLSAGSFDDIANRLQALVTSQADLFPPDTQVQCTVVQGEFVNELVRAAALHSADLICTSRWSHRAHDPLSMSTTRLVRKSPCSVLIVVGVKKPTFRHLLVPMDFSDESREALDVACAIAKVTPGSSVTVQHGYRVPLDYLVAGQTYDETAAQVKADAQWKWNKTSALVDLRGIPWSVRYDLTDDVPSAILTAAEQTDTDLVVLASHGLTRAAGMLLGHVTDIVCAKSDRSLLVVKRKGEVVTLLRALLQLFDADRTGP